MLVLCTCGAVMSPESVTLWLDSAYGCLSSHASQIHILPSRFQELGVWPHRLRHLQAGSIWAITDNHYKYSMSFRPMIYALCEPVGSSLTRWVNLSNYHFPAGTAWPKLVEFKMHGTKLRLA